VPRLQPVSRSLKFGRKRDVRALLRFQNTS
jgi:hypothetical protein